MLIRPPLNARHFLFSVEAHDDWVSSLLIPVRGLPVSHRVPLPSWLALTILSENQKVANTQNPI